MKSKFYSFTKSNKTFERDNKYMLILLNDILLSFLLTMFAFIVSININFLSLFRVIYLIALIVLLSAIYDYFKHTRASLYADFSTKMLYYNSVKNQIELEGFKQLVVLKNSPMSKEFLEIKIDGKIQNIKVDEIKDVMKKTTYIDTSRNVEKKKFPYGVGIYNEKTNEFIFLLDLNSENIEEYVNYFYEKIDVDKITSITSN